MIDINLKNSLMPAMGFGTWRLRDKDAVDCVECALDVGYRHIDTAQFYENENEVGQAIKNSKIDREKIFITTKIWPTHFVESTALDSFDQSLRRLETDYVDLLLIHAPLPDISIKAMIDQLMQIKNQGKVKDIGVSNFNIAQTAESISQSGGAICNNQIEFHPYLNTDKIKQYCESHNVRITAYCPAARGKVLDDKVFLTLAEKYSKNPVQICLRWALQKNVAVIPKSSRRENIAGNFDIFDFSLSDEEVSQIDQLKSLNLRLVAPKWPQEWD